MLSPLPRRSDWAYCFAHFTQPCQPSPIWQSGRPAHCPFRGLLGVHSRYGLHTRAVTVFRDTLSEGFSHFVTSIAAPVASGWSGCRVGFAPTGKRRLFTAHAKSEHCEMTHDGSLRANYGHPAQSQFLESRHRADETLWGPRGEVAVRPTLVSARRSRQAARATRSTRGGRPSA
jgi:hypothetical protein